MNLKHRRTQLQLITLAIAVALTALTLTRIITGTTLPPMVEPPEGPLATTIIAVYSSFPYLAPLAWVAFLLTLFWKGKIRTLWQSKNYDYDTFKVLARMRGSSSRIKILQSLSIPKNKLQLANELGMDWKSIDGHIDILIQYNLVKEMIYVGTAKYLLITERGKDVLELLKHGEPDSRSE